MFSIPGKVCNVCGVWKPLAEYHEHPNMRDGHLNTCKVCKRAYISDWRRDNPDKVSAKNQRGYYKDHEKTKKQRLDSYYRHRDTAARYHAQWHREHRAEARERTRAYRQKNPEWAKITNRNNSLRRRNPALGSFTVAEWMALCAYYDFRCLCCDEQTDLTADHVVPLARGGMNTIDNIQPLCQSCNSQKSTKTTDYRSPDQDAALLRQLSFVFDDTA